MDRENCDKIMTAQVPRLRIFAGPNGSGNNLQYDGFFLLET
jgi:hypothetical protein